MTDFRKFVESGKLFWLGIGMLLVVISPVLAMAVVISALILMYFEYQKEIKTAVNIFKKNNKGGKS